MKVCSRCKLPKDETEFHKKTGERLQSHCKDCQRLYVKKHYDNNREYYLAKAVREQQRKIAWYVELKSKLKCEKCGENHPALLDFHHTDPAEKDMEVAAMMRKYGRKRILAEIAKCKIWCSHCHRKFHWNEKHPEYATVAQLDRASDYGSDG